MWIRVLAFEIEIKTFKAPDPDPDPEPGWRPLGLSGLATGIPH